MPPRARVDARVLDQLRKRAENDRMPADLRLAALAAIPRSLGKLKPNAFSFVLKHLDRDRELASRPVLWPTEANP